MARLAALLLVLVAVTFATPAAVAEPVGIPVVVHVTRLANQPIASETQVRELIAAVNQSYAGSDVCFVVQAIRSDDGVAELVTYRHRRAFRRSLVTRAINVFLVHSIKDPSTSESTARALARVGRKASGWLAGAEIPAPRRKPSRYLIVTFSSGALTLAHELGHFLGEGHHKDPANLMSYGLERKSFDLKQLAAFGKRARREFKSGSLTRKRCD